MGTRSAREDHQAGAILESISRSLCCQMVSLNPQESCTSHLDFLQPDIGQIKGLEALTAPDLTGS